MFRTEEITHNSRGLYRNTFFFWENLASTQILLNFVTIYIDIIFKIPNKMMQHELLSSDGCVPELLTTLPMHMKVKPTRTKIKSSTRKEKGIVYTQLIWKMMG